MGCTLIRAATLRNFNAFRRPLRCSPMQTAEQTTTWNTCRLREGLLRRRIVIYVAMRTTGVTARPGPSGPCGVGVQPSDDSGIRMGDAVQRRRKKHPEIVCELLLRMRPECRRDF